jgi:predicted metalloprotease with PDZ domain
MVNGKMARLATYPVGTLFGPARDSTWNDIKRMIPTEGAVFQETQWDTYNVMMIFSPDFPGGSALEHQNSHVGVYTPQLIGTPILPSITAHEMFHSWNVKRMRPSEMVPYRYDQAQPTVWLWVSEGITDYYADLTLVRSGIVDSSRVLRGDRQQDRERSADRAGGTRGRLALDLDPSHRRDRLHLLSQGLSRRLHARHPDPRR